MSKKKRCIVLDDSQVEKALIISKKNGKNKNNQNTISHGVQIAVETYKIKE